LSHSARHTGSADLVIVTTTSARATQASPLSTGSVSTPSSSATAKAKAVRCSRDGL
jgi:hypothetical protein